MQPELQEVAEREIQVFDLSTYPLLIGVPVKVAWHVAILVPARDEEDLLPRCLNSIELMRRATAPGVTTDLIVVSDNCTDKTHSLAAELVGKTGLVAPSSFGNVGAARALAAQLALARYGGPLDRCWLANTDADCIIPSQWITLQLSLAEAGCAAIAGVVDVDQFEDHSPTVPKSFRQTYILHEDGTHPHVHGANLGVRADAYELVGGWAPKQTAEDHDLWRRLRAAQVPCVADTRLQVITSGRRVGRAPDGFAAALAAHNGVQA